MNIYQYYRNIYVSYLQFINSNEHCPYMAKLRFPCRSTKSVVCFFEGSFWTIEHLLASVV